MEYMPRLRKDLRRLNGVLLIADEVMTGPGAATGKVGSPWIIGMWRRIFSRRQKGITNAAIPLGLVCHTDGKKIASYFGRAIFFSHGHTYEAHPLNAGSGGGFPLTRLKRLKF